MKSLALLLCGIASMSTLAAAGAQTPKVRSVYLLPMSGGLDQYLANSLASGGVVQVVTDPKKADAVLSDQLGESLEKRMEELYPVEPPAESKPAVAETEKADSEKKESTPQVDTKAAEEARKTREKPVRVFSSGRARGTLFLVDVQSRNVIWSAFEKPKNTTAEQMDRTARRIAGRLKRDLQGGK